MRKRLYKFDFLQVKKFFSLSPHYYVNMVVYVEYVLVSNFFIDAFIAYITLISLKMRVSKARISLACLAGSLFALAVPYINFAAAGVVKVLMLMLLTALMSKYPSFKRYLLAALLYFLYTAALGGAVLVLNNMAVSQFVNALYYPGNLAGAYIAAAGILLVYIVRQITGYIARRRMCGGERKVVLSAGKGKISCEGIIDTGNTLMRGGKGVIVIDKRLAKKLIGKGAKRIAGIWVKTVTGESYMPAIEIRTLTFPEESGRSVFGVTAAISDTSMGEFKVILPNGI